MSVYSHASAVPRTRIVLYMYMEWAAHYTHVATPPPPPPHVIYMGLVCYVVVIKNIHTYMYCRIMCSCLSVLQRSLMKSRLHCFSEKSNLEHTHMPSDLEDDDIPIE